MKELKAKKSLGQNFLKDEIVLQKIANSILVNKDDLLIEIGPGMGALSKYLVKKDCLVVAFEIDKRMEQFLKLLPLEVYYQDFLQVDIVEFLEKRNFKNLYVIANIPYYITTPIIEHIMVSGIIPKEMTLLVQKEVADRFSSKVHQHERGFFTVYLEHYFDVEKLFDVSPQSFSPAPKVMSSVVHFKRKDNITSLPPEFLSFVKKAFQQKRKTLKNNWRDYDWNKIYNVLRKYGYQEQVRAEDIPYEIFVEIFQNLY